jgi:hypothetical protein
MPNATPAVDVLERGGIPGRLPDTFDPIEPIVSEHEVWLGRTLDRSEVGESLPVTRPRRIRRIAIFMLLISIIVGALYGTGIYVRGTGLWSAVWGSFHSQTATANTDVNLRSEPNPGSDAIGIVTKNSKVRIVNSQNNWYQVDVVEQGRDRTGGPNATRGWLNGRYIDLDNN